MVKKTEKKEVKSPLNGTTLPVPGPGRPKGSKNKYTNLKNAFLEVFDMLGGVQALHAWANKNDRNKHDFYQWTTKMLPAQVVGEQDDNGLFRPIRIKLEEIITDERPGE